MKLVWAHRHENYMAMIVVCFFYAQYNPFFLKEFLWLQYWGGGAIRTAVAAVGMLFLAAYVCFILASRQRLSGDWKLALVGSVFLLIAVYGFGFGAAIGGNFDFIYADAAGFLEPAGWLLLFGLSSKTLAASVLKIIKRLWPYFALTEIIFFAVSYDAVIVAAEISGVRLSRLVDFVAPMMLIIYLWGDNKTLGQRFGLALAVLVVGLGLFRSQWAALVCVAFVAAMGSALRSDSKPLAKFFLFGSCGWLLAECVVGLYLGVTFPLSGRVAAAIGTADSLGRLSTAADVFEQLTESWFGFLFGHGFGHMVYYVNDFGDGRGPVRDWQPVGALSNYAIVLIAYFGALITALIIFPALLVMFMRCVQLGYRRDSVGIPLSLYVLLQFLTFPNTIHFPTFMLLAIVLRADGPVGTPPRDSIGPTHLKRSSPW